MSEDAAKQFIEKLKSDTAMQHGVANAVRDAAESAVVKIGADSGLSFTTEDLVHAYINGLKAQGHSDADIEDLMAAGHQPAFTYGVDPSPYHDAASFEGTAVPYTEVRPYAESDKSPKQPPRVARPY